MQRILKKTPFIRPMLATLTQAPPIGPEWMHEIKFDGFRAQAHFRAGKVALYSRSGSNFFSRFERLRSTLEAVAVRTAILDCELVAYDANGRQSFQMLMDSGPKAEILSLFAFDLLELNGARLLDLPLHRRRELLAKLITATGEPALLFSEEIIDPNALLATASERGLEGIVSKRRVAPYVSGRSRDWLKVKTEAWRAAKFDGSTNVRSR